MLILSVFMGIRTNIGWMTLYGSEFAEPWAEFTTGRPNQNIFPFWFLLIIAHISAFSLLFLADKLYFKTVLFGFPLGFIVSFILYDILSSFFLIPFIIVWLIALFKQRNKVKHSN